LAWFERIEDAERAQRLVGALWTFAWLRGHLREGQDWVRRSLAIPGGRSGTSRAWVMVGDAGLTWNRGDFANAWTLGEEALAASREVAFPLGVAVSLLLLAETAWMQGDLERARVVGEDAVAHLRGAGHPGWLAVFLVDLGTIARLTGDDERGATWSREGLALNRTLGNRWIIANHLSDLGVVAQDGGDSVEAARLYAESVGLFREVGDTWYIAHPIAGLAAFAVARGHPETAVRLLGVAAALREASGSPVWTTEQERDEHTVAMGRAALGEEGFARALEAGRKLPLLQAVAEAIGIVEAGPGHPGDDA
jgi:hypothetical protein